VAIAILDWAKINLSSDELRVYVNLKNDEDGFTAIHFCSFKGNLRLARLLENLGADIYEKNNFGINVLHVAA
jgi:ankyrin repeat protein